MEHPGSFSFIFDLVLIHECIETPPWQLREWFGAMLRCHWDNRGPILKGLVDFKSKDTGICRPESHSSVPQRCFHLWFKFGHSQGLAQHTYVKESQLFLSATKKGTLWQYRDQFTVLVKTLSQHWTNSVPTWIAFLEDSETGSRWRLFRQKQNWLQENWASSFRNIADRQFRFSVVPGKIFSGITLSNLGRCHFQKWMLTHD